MRGPCGLVVKKGLKHVCLLLVFLTVVHHVGGFLKTFFHIKQTNVHADRLVGNIGASHDNLRLTLDQDNDEQQKNTTNYMQKYSNVNIDNLDGTPRGIRLEWPEHDEQALGIYILTVIGSNTTRYAGYERDIKLNGWWSTKHNNDSIKCCLLWPNKTFSEFKNPTVEKRSSSTKYVATQIDCPINVPFSDVDGVALQFAGTKCPVDDKMYTKPVIPLKSEADESLAVCLKIVFGTVNNINFIAYLEFLRVMKVDKVFIFSYNITEETNAVIEHYVKLGLVDRRPYNYPFRSTRSLTEKRTSVYEDKRVALLDCIQRSSGYKYMTVIDMDEYLLPKMHDNYKELMKYVMLTYPNAAGFKFDSYMFPKDVGPDPNAPANGSDVVKYFRRTQALYGSIGRNKILFMPTRITTKGYYTHSFRPLDGYEKVHLNNSIAAINHYRMCPSDVKSICFGNLTEDKSILKFVEKFKNITWFLSK